MKCRQNLAKTFGGNNPLPAILVCDRYTAFREALKNFLLAAGYSQVEVVATVRETLARLRNEHYGYVLIGVSRPVSAGQRLAAMAQRRQPEAKIFILVAAKDQPFVKDATFETVIKEYVYSTLLACDVVRYYYLIGYVK